MRGIRMDSNGPPTKGLVELNCHSIQDGQNEVRDGITGEGQGLSEEDESRINEDVEGGNETQRDLVHVQAVLQTQQQQPQGPLVRWDRFLPIRSLKVLLVENDDSTRHVVSALLRNCSYEVTAVGNALEAWRILGDLANHVDLVLTEVAMPYLSGIGLLSKIMNHKTRKNVPVIMMSANDSMGIVFKCLSKGAVDFLVKPIRKNELKNLWQHVWRKCHSSSGSGSESGVQTQKSTKSKSVEGSLNNTDSNDEAENGSFDLDDRDGSDNGSGTQSSWSKRAIEVDSPQPLSPWNELADPPDSTCAQVVHSRPEALSATWVPATAPREYRNEKDELGNARMCKDLNIGVTNVPMLEGRSGKAMDDLAARMKDKHLELDPKDSEKMVRNLKHNKETREDDLKDIDVGYRGDHTKTGTPLVESMANEVPKDPSKITNIKEIATYDSKGMPSLELSLKQLQDIGETGAQERNILRHSDLSAFSRYNAPASNANQAPTGNVGSCSPVNNSSEVAKTESLHNLRSKSSSTPNQRSNGSSNNNDMGSSTNNFFVKQETLTDKPITKPAVNAHTCSAFQPVQHGHNSSLQPMVPGKQDAAKTALAQARAMRQQVQVQHHHHHYHHHHHHVLDLKQQQQLLDTDDSSMRNAVGAAPNFGTSDTVGTPVEGNAANYGSASGSNNGSNGQNRSSSQNGSSTALIAEGTNLVAENEAGEKCEIGSVSGSASRSDHSAQRVAALIKFRQKRKERCFEKKVRYQSRKRLAEQRPRVRGQFVRQDADKNKSNDDS